MLSKKAIISTVSLFLAILFIMNGCSHNPKSIKIVQQMTPSWFLNPPQNSHTYMYGVGMANSRQGAIKKALDDMISKLSINIKSSYKSKIEQHNYYINTKITNNIQTNIIQIEINNYKILQTKLIGYNKFATLIQVDKRRFKHGLIYKLNNMQKIINLKYKLLNTNNIIIRYNTLRKLVKKTKKMKHLLQIISELKGSGNKRFDKLTYLADIIKVEQRFLALRNKLSFYILPNNNSLLFIQAIKNFLTKRGFVVTNKKRNDSIVINVNINDSIYKNIYMNIMAVHVNIRVFNNSLHVGGKSFIFKQRYIGSKQKVYQAAVFDFNAKLVTKTIKEVLGINL